MSPFNPTSTERLKLLLFSILAAALIAAAMEIFIESWWLDLGLVIAIAGLGYSIAEAIVFRERKEKSRKDEGKRKALHIASNLATCL